MRRTAVSMVLVLIASVLSSPGSSPVEADTASWETVVAGDSPQHWLRLDEPAGAPVAVDSVGDLDADYGTTKAVPVDGFDGTAGAAASFGSGGSSPLFFQDGSDVDYSTATVEVIAAPGSGVGRHRIVRRWTHGFQIDWLPQSGQIYAAVTLAKPDGTTFSQVGLTAHGVSEEEWHHIVLSVGSSSVQLWVDGVEADVFNYSSSLSTGIRYTDSGMTLASDSAQNTIRKYTGDIDEFVVYNRALSAAEILDHFDATGLNDPPPPPLADTYSPVVLADSPLGYWRFEEAVGDPVAIDSAGSNDGTYPSSTPPNLEVEGAVPGSTAVEFTGRKRVVNLPPEALDLGDAYSIELWMKPDGGVTSGTGRVIRARGNGFAMNFRPATQELQVWTYDGSGWAEIYSDPLSLDRWHHVVMTMENSVLGLHINGELIGVAAMAGDGTLNSGSQLTVGNDYPGKRGRTFWGAVDELAIYDRALTTAEVGSHYTASNRPLPVAADANQAIAGCIANGGNFYLDAPTVLDLDGYGVQSYDAGCYYYESCISTFPTFLGGAQSFVCENQVLINTVLASVAVTSGAVAAAGVCIGGGCALAMLAGQTGQVSAQTAAGTAANTAVLLYVVTAAFENNQQLETFQFGNGYAPAPVADLGDVFSGSNYGNNGNGIPILPGETCPDGSPREGQTIPEIPADRWSHILTEHHAGFNNQDPPDPNKSQFDPDYSLDDIGNIIRTAYCWGIEEPNAHTGTGGHTYDVEFSQATGGQLLQNGTYVTHSGVRIVVNANQLSHTGYPFPL